MIEALSPSALYTVCDPGSLPFVTTEELEPLSEIVVQKNALSSVDFGINIAQEGYNLYAMGPSGSGKHSVIDAFLTKKASGEPPGEEWCYVNRFDDPRSPLALRFPAGKAREFKTNVAELIELFKTILPSVFESNDYRNLRESVNQKYISLQADIFENLSKEAEKYQIALNTSSSSRVTFVPIVDGKPVTAEEFQEITGEEKEAIMARLNAFEAIVKEGLQEVSRLNKMQQRELIALERQVSADTVHALMAELRDAYRDSPKVLDYFDKLQDDVIGNVRDFLIKPEESGMPPFVAEFYTPSFRRYDVNLFIDRTSETSSPIVYEDNPTYQNLIGSIEHLSQMGTLVTDFSMIKPGALHKANGGYLILDAHKLLFKPFAWEALKRALRSREVRIESVAQELSLVSTTTLEPEPIPLDLKVILIGERIFYYLLYHYDPEFKELFKVSADFEDDMARSAQNSLLYARMMGTIARRNDLLPLSRDAVARVIEHAAREAQDASKISTHLGALADLLKEADYWGRKEGRALIERNDIDTALSSQIQRSNRIQNRLYDQIREGTIRIALEGSVIGQVNALTYVSLGNHRFGLPSCITARTRPGKGEIIDIERKAELSGPIHTKGVMILGAYLGSTYAARSPFSLTASIVFEQSYAMIDGDSASSTELYAILSSLAELPVAQNIAVTGSVNQFGQVQAIGGVNEKIEGFFDVCMHHDPTGHYGVLIPKANVKHLMLKPDVVAAAKEGRFSLYPVETIDEGISILTGVEAGARDEGGHYPSGTLNARVQKRLETFAKAVRESSRSVKSRKKES